MIPVRQRIVAAGNSAQVPGDCFKCCIASVLELPYEEVPHFVAAEWQVDAGCGEGPQKRDCYTSLNDWLLRGGWPLVYVHRTYYVQPSPKGEPGKDVPYWDYLLKQSHPHQRFPGYWIASVLSSNFPNTTHAVVMLGSEVAHDPSPRTRRAPYVFVGDGFFLPRHVARCRPDPTTRAVHPGIGACIVARQGGSQ